MSQAVFELLAEDIRTLGVEMAFGLMSDDTATLVNALGASGVRFLSARHENAAVAMAEGYAAATGRLGVAVIGRGPAAANCVNAIVHASRTGSRVLVIYGDAPRTASANGPGPDLKAFNQAAMLTAAGITVFKPYNAASMRGVLTAAADAANRGEAAALLLPKDLLEEKVDRPADTFAYRPTPKLFVPTKRGQPGIVAAATLLKTARKPLILAGWGAVQADARAAIEILGDAIGAAYLTTLRASGFFDGNAFEIGVIGSFSTSLGRRFIDDADCLIVIGASLNVFTTSAGNAIPPGVPIIQIDADRAAIGRHWYADLGLVGDANAVATALAAACGVLAEEAPFRSEANRDSIAAFDPANDVIPAHTERTVDPRGFAVALTGILPNRRNTVLDVGNFFQIVPFLGVTEPRRLKYTSEFASIGLSFGTALGFCAGSPDVPTFLFTGDGSLLMTLGELSTCVSEDLPLVIVVLNDACLAAERHYLDIREMPIDKTMLPMIDFADVAASFGFETATITRMNQLEALRPLLAAPTSPVLIDVKINPAVAAGFLAEFTPKG